MRMRILVFGLIVCLLPVWFVLPLNGKGPPDALFEAAKNGDMVALTGLLKGKTNVNIKDKQGATPLMWAAVEGHLVAVKALLDKGADINAKDEYGATALMFVSVNG